MSVILAAYHCAEFVDRAIASALSQEGIDVEVVVVDDCSTDATPSVLNEWQRREPRVRYFRNDRNLGPSGTRNRAIQEARGDWLAVLDADDAFYPGSLQTLVKRALDSGADLVAGNFEYFNHARQKGAGPAFSTTAADQFLAMEPFLAGARPNLPHPDFGLLKPVFRRQFLAVEGIAYPESLRHAEDFQLIVNCLAAGGHYLFCPEVLAYSYTTRDSGLSRTVVNYDAVIDNTLSLLLREDVMSKLSSTRVIDRRVAELRLHQFNVWFGATRSWSERLMFLARCFQSSAGRTWLTHYIRRRLARTP